MSWDWSIFESISVGASAIIATATFILYFRDQRQRDNRDKTLSWQQTVIHHIFQRSPNKWLSFDEIKKEYRSEATVRPTAVNAAELTDESLRRILIRMVSSRIIDQKGGDKYCLSTIIDEILDNSMKNMVDELFGAFKPKDGNTTDLNQYVGDRLSTLAEGNMAKETAIFNCTVNIVAEHSGELTLSDIVLKASKATQIDYEAVQAKINTMLAKGDILYSDGHYIHIRR